MTRNIFCFSTFFVYKIPQSLEFLDDCDVTINRVMKLLGRDRFRFETVIILGAGGGESNQFLVERISST